MGLLSISNEALAPLSEFSTIPLVTKGVPFEQKDPELGLYLSQNNLCRLPPALFDVRHLTTLTLRNNKLTELPPAIGKLRHLRDLNVAQNSLRWLPVELLDLLSGVRPAALHNVHLHPNPFLQPETASDVGISISKHLSSYDGRQSGLPGGPAPSAFHPAFFWGRSPVQFSDTYGTIYSTFELEETVSPVPVATEPETTPVIHGRDLGPSAVPTKVPSLLDLALRAAYSSQALPHVSAYLDGYEHIQALLGRLTAQRESGDMWCATCKAPLVTVKTAWLEWWGLTKAQPHDLTSLASSSEETNGLWRYTLLNPEPDEALVPFLRRGCSWKCMPRDIKSGVWYHEQP